MYGKKTRKKVREIERELRYVSTLVTIVLVEFVRVGDLFVVVMSGNRRSKRDGSRKGQSR